MRSSTKFLLVPAMFIALVLAGVSVGSYAALFQLPGVVPPSGCRDGAVLSTDQFTSTGFSNVRTARPNDEIVAGAWVVANNFTPDTSVIEPPNCEDFDDPIDPDDADDDLGLNLMAVRILPTIGSATEANVTEVKLVWDVNANALWDPLLDLVLMTKPGSVLDTQDGAVFFNGPQSPLAYLTDTEGGDDPCHLGSDDDNAGAGIEPDTGTNSRGEFDDEENGCFIALLAIVVIGDTPQTGTQFGLELEALAGDVPGTTGISSATFSSGFSSSRNPQASNVRLHMIGGSPSSHTPLEHLSNGSGGPESGVKPLSFTGGKQGEGLLTRFRALEIIPGTREVIAMVVGICDGGELANTNAAILPPIDGAPPTIAGGLSSLPCIPSKGTDGLATGINGATLIFRGPLARYMQTVRFYVDECSIQGVNEEECEPIDSFVPGGEAPEDAVPTLETTTGGGDGFLFQPGELSEQVVPIFNEMTGESIATFGGRQEQILFTGNHEDGDFGSSFNPVAYVPDPICQIAASDCPDTGGDFALEDAGTTPLILIFTVDIDSNAPGGVVDVLLGLQTYDDTAQANGSDEEDSQDNPCEEYNDGLPEYFLLDNVVDGVCGSNFLTTGPEIYSFTIEGPEHPSTPNSLSAFDTNAS